MPAEEFRGEITAIYAELDRRPVERDCRLRAGCCQFRVTGRIPRLTRGEAIFAAEGLRRSGRIRMPERPDGACPLLGRDGRCLIYEHRPFGCRTHYCREAGGMLPRATVRDLIQRLDALDERLGGDGAKRLEKAIGDVL